MDRFLDLLSADEISFNLWIMNHVGYQSHNPLIALKADGEGGGTSTMRVSKTACETCWLKMCSVGLWCKNPSHVKMPQPTYI